MQDLTQGSVARNIVVMAMTNAAGTIFQTLLLLIDLYFIAGVGKPAVAGVSAAGSAVLVIVALTQILSVGAVALISQAVGRNDRNDANLVFNQSLVFAALTAVATLALGYATSSAYLTAVTSDPATHAAGATYLYWFLPGLALQFALVTMGAALRGTGIVKPTMIAQSFAVVLNMLLAPVLIAGWGTGRPLDVAGAGLSSTIAVAAGVAVLTTHFVKVEKYVELRSSLWRPQLDTFRRLLAVGLPAGGELVLMFVFLGVMHLLISDFGPEAQAGFGIGSRIMQSVALPATAIAFAVGPMAGQNLGAGRLARVRETFAKALLLCSAAMLFATLLLQWRPEVLVALFTAEADVQAVGVDFLQVISFMFVAQGVVLACSGMFQGLGDTRPALASYAMRLGLFVPLAFWLAARPDFQLWQLWYLTVASVWIQAAASCVLLRSHLRRRHAATPVVAPSAYPRPAP